MSDIDDYGETSSALALEPNENSMVEVHFIFYAIQIGSSDRVPVAIHDMRCRLRIETVQRLQAEMAFTLFKVGAVEYRLMGAEVKPSLRNYLEVRLLEPPARQNIFEFDRNGWVKGFKE